MIRLILTSCLLLTGLAVQAQDKAQGKTKTTPAQQQELLAPDTKPAPAEAAPVPTRISLSDAPAMPAPSGAKVNKDLLQPSGQGPATPYRTTQTTTGIGGTTVQPVNATSNQFNLGNQKATNTIYYDQSGRVIGNNSSIQLGGKK